MTEYIKKAYVEQCMNDSFRNGGIPAEARKKFQKWLDKAPAADVVERKRGRWLPVDEQGDAFDCSECDAMVAKRVNYCPKCGAKMEESEEANG